MKEVVQARGQADERSPDTTLQGTVERLTFQNEESGFTVLRLDPERGFGDPQALLAIERRLTAVGLAPGVGEGQRIRLTGEWGEHPKHGRRFRFDSCRVLPPLDPEGLARYLASKVFRGVGPKLAGRIVEALGTNALARIREDPGVLASVRGLRPKVREELVGTIRTELGSQELFAFLLGVGLGPAQADLVARRLGPDAEEQLRENPYRLASGISGLGFRTADRVARSLGLAEDAPERRRAALLHVLGTAAGEGHVLLPGESLYERAAELLRGPTPEPEDLAELVREGEVVVDEATRPGVELVYLPQFHTSEVRLAENLRALVATAPVRPIADADALAVAERDAGIALHPGQREAVLGLLSEPVGLVTGGPGVGKTTLVRLVVSLAEAAGLSVSLASPTGRAAKRLAEATDREASTIHRLLGWEPGTGRFQHHQGHPLEADLLVIDEVSMVDLVLAHHLIKAVQPPTRVVLVGDPDQLPSVSAGNVLADLLGCGRIPVFRLSHVYRQGAESLIVTNAHRILLGELPRLPEGGTLDSDFYFFRTEDEEGAAERVVDVVTRRIPERFGLDWVRDVQVLSPMYRGPAGVDSLNERLRRAQGIGGREIRWGGRTWRVGDRVIHTRNDYERLVFNGDLGRITRIHADGTGLTVRFPERELFYQQKEIADLQPAFAITVHRSQGGEFPAVVLPLVPRHHPMLQRHLLYTAITRAQRLVVLVGSWRAVTTAVENAEVNERESALADRLREVSEPRLL